MKSEAVVLRIYASYDADLISLLAHGVPIATFAYNVLKAYAYHTHVNYVLPDFGEEKEIPNKTCRTRFVADDENMIRVLASIRPRKKNLFIKTLMRDALVRQNFSAFFTSDAPFLDDEREANKSLSQTDDVIVLRKGSRAISIDSILENATAVQAKPGKTISMDREVEDYTKKATRKPARRNQKVAPVVSENQSADEWLQDVAGDETAEPSLTDNQNAEILSMLTSMVGDL